jgi:hypothetical protein
VSIVDYGVIKELKLPPGWVETTPAYRGPFDIRSLRKFVRQDSGDAQFCIYYRGLPVSQPAAEAFQRVIAHPSSYQLTPEDLLEISEILDTAANEADFSIRSAQTLNLGGVGVVCLEGRWTELGFDSYMIFADPRINGQIEQLYFAASGAAYEQNLNGVKRALSLIEWST